MELITRDGDAGILRPMYEPLVEAFEFQKYRLSESQASLLGLLEEIHSGWLTRLEGGEAEKSERV